MTRTQIIEGFSLERTQAGRRCTQCQLEESTAMGGLGIGNMDRNSDLLGFYMNLKGSLAAGD